MQTEIIIAADQNQQIAADQAAQQAPTVQPLLDLQLAMVAGGGVLISGY